MVRRVLLLWLILAVATGPSTVFAHMGIETSEPANAATVVEAPEQATLTFNADVDIETAAAQLRRLGPADTPITEALRRDVPTDPLAVVVAEGRTAVFDLPDLDNGLYAIDWSVNEAGGHANTSFILFKVSDDGAAFGDQAGRRVAPYFLYTAVTLILVGLAVLLRRRRS